MMPSVPDRRELFKYTYIQEERKMSKEKRLITLVVLALFLASAICTVFLNSTKPDFYYDDVELIAVTGDISAFDKKFNKIEVSDLYRDGGCSAGTGDFVMLRVASSDNYYDSLPFAKTVSDADYLESLAVKMAEKGAKALVYSTHLYNGETRYSGVLYEKDGGTIKKTELRGESDKEFVRNVKHCADKPSLAVPMLVISALLLAALAILTIPAQIEKTNLKLMAEYGEACSASDRLTKSKYRISLIAACVLTVLNSAWLIVPNLYMLAEHYFNESVLQASLFSIPFLLFSVLALLNMKSFKIYWKGVNIISLVLAGIVLAFLLVVIIMMIV